MNAADIRPGPPAERRQPALDLFLIFACANIVATTFQTGASLSPAFSLRTSLGSTAGGTLAGSPIRRSGHGSGPPRSLRPARRSDCAVPDWSPSCSTPRISRGSPSTT
jgi:hypothetical protein